MKKALLSTIAIVGLFSGTSFAMQDATHSMGAHPANAQAQDVAVTGSKGEAVSNPSGMINAQGMMMEMRGHGMKGKCSGMMMKHGKMSGMSGKMHHGKMAGQSGMNAHGMMGLGLNVPGQKNWTPEEHEQFLNETRAIRKELVVKRYEISEAQRNINATPVELGKLEKELIDIRTRIQQKALEINVAATKG